MKKLWNKLKALVDFAWRMPEIQGVLISFGISFILGIIVVIIVLVKML